MKEEDLKRTKKIATDIVELVRHRDPNISGEYLREFMATHPRAYELINRLMDQQRATELEAKIKEREKADDIEHMVAHLSTLKVTKRNRMRHIIIAGTVAATMIAASFLIFNHTSSDVPQRVTENEKITQPLLVTASGQQLIIVAKNKKIVATDFIQKQEAIDVVTNNKLIIPSKNMLSVILPDGTEVTLNAQSELEYPSKFIGDRRAVRLRGEAYFKVTPSQTPFLVSVGDGEVRVYGTTFSIKEQGKGGIEAVLVSGSVGVKYQGGNEVMIKPNQRIVINAKTYTIEDIDAEQHIGWLNNSFQYYNTEAHAVIDDIEKWYGIKIVNSVERIGRNEKISFNVSRDYSLSKIITLLEEALNITIRDEGGDNYRIK